MVSGVFPSRSDAAFTPRSAEEMRELVADHLCWHGICGSLCPLVSILVFLCGSSSSVKGRRVRVGSGVPGRGATPVAVSSMGVIMVDDVSTHPGGHRA